MDKKIISTSQSIPAFTTIELMVSIAISAIIFYFGFTLIQRGNREFQKYSNEFNRLNELKLFTTRLNADATMSRGIRSEGNLLIFQTDSSEIRYQINDSSIVRLQKEHLESFSLNIKTSQFQSEKDSDLVVYCCMIIQIDDLSYPIIFHKRYSSFQKLQRINNSND